ncbi:MAG: TlpA family protein disulfide reductase [Corynebacterium sp.]|uniref:TlpA family protein disulfide reductase n=1 Tax=Corynebacterium sp. TaxID=1720 RepID=UPI003F9CECB0
MGKDTRNRTILLAIAVVVGLAVASVPLFISVFGADGQDGGPPADPSTGAGNGAGLAGGAETGEPLPEPTTTPDPAGTSYRVSDQQRIDCPSPGGDGPGTAAPDAELAGITLPCLTDGGEASEAPLAETLSGRPTLVNVWAWWCGPCRQELPVLQDVAEKHPEWNIVGVHVNERGQAGVDLLADLDVRFASFQDSEGELSVAANLPSVVPLSLVYGPDGSRSELHPGELTSVEEVEDLMARSMDDR